MVGGFISLKLARIQSHFKNGFGFILRIAKLVSKIVSKALNFGKLTIRIGIASMFNCVKR